ncbi:MAG: isopenicillin N synthase family dioxygenase [Parashewanella sp.]
MTTLPTLFLSDFYADAKTKAQFIADLGFAARNVGFFYLKGHGVSPERQQQIFSLSKRFFSLPLEDKVSVEMKNSPHFRGYTRVGQELTQGKSDFREQFDTMREEEFSSNISSNPPWFNLHGPNQWPSKIPSMKPELLGFQNELSHITTELLKALALTLEQSEHAFDSSIEDAPFQHMKLIRYPGMAQESQGVGAHKDAGYLTLVMQDEHTGLEVETATGWISVPSEPDSFVVNIGELLELASDGFLKATMHRVVSPPVGHERYSLAFFLAAKLEKDVPLITLPNHLKSLAVGPESDPNNPLLHHVGENVLKSRLRAHPDVASIHYSKSH